MFPVTEYKKLVRHSLLKIWAANLHKCIDTGQNT